MDYGRIVDVVANGFKRIEELDPEATVLNGFPRSIQFDEYSCGLHAVYGILRYYGRGISKTRLEKLLRTNGNGTDLADIKRVLRHHGLVCRTNAHGPMAFSILLSLMLVGIVNKGTFQRQVLVALRSILPNLKKSSYLSLDNIYHGAHPHLGRMEGPIG